MHTSAHALTLHAAMLCYAVLWESARATESRPNATCSPAGARARTMCSPNKRPFRPPLLALLARLSRFCAVCWAGLVSL